MIKAVHCWIYVGSPHRQGVFFFFFPCLQSPAILEGLTSDTDKSDTTHTWCESQGLVFSDSW